jgi:hypothetical protein
MTDASSRKPMLAEVEVGGHDVKQIFMLTGEHIMLSYCCHYQLQATLMDDSPAELGAGGHRGQPPRSAAGPAVGPCGMSNSDNAFKRQPQAMRMDESKCQAHPGRGQCRDAAM